MKNLLQDFKYELVRTLKHILYVVLVICWFIVWYGIIGLILGTWNIELWTDDIWQMYIGFTTITGFVYFMYRLLN